MSSFFLIHKNAVFALARFIPGLESSGTIKV